MAIDEWRGRWRLLLTGHSLGGMLAILTASSLGLQAITFAPTPWQHVQAQSTSTLISHIVSFILMGMGMMHVPPCQNASVSVAIYTSHIVVEACY